MTKKNVGALPDFSQNGFCPLIISSRPFFLTLNNSKSIDTSNILRRPKIWKKSPNFIWRYYFCEWSYLVKKKRSSHFLFSHILKNCEIKFRPGSFLRMRYSSNRGSCMRKNPVIVKSDDGYKQSSSAWDTLRSKTLSLERFKNRIPINAAWIR